MPLSEQLLNTHSFKMKLISQMKLAPKFLMQDERNLCLAAQVKQSLTKCNKVQQIQPKLNKVNQSLTKANKV